MEAMEFESELQFAYADGYAHGWDAGYEAGYLAADSYIQKESEEAARA